MNKLEDSVKEVIRDVQDFPIKGIVFKDITTLLSNPEINKLVLKELAIQAEELNPDVIVGIDSRGFLYGNSIAMNLNLPFVPVRKKGKLPYETVSESYSLEYGEATLEAHVDSISKGQKVLIHDDLLATGGTAIATAKLVEKMGGVVIGFSFIINLSFLPGAKKIEEISNNLFSIVTY